MNDAPLMLSVSGLRGIVGASLTPAVAARYAAAVGHYLKASAARDADLDAAHANNPPVVVVGRDSRPSGQMIEMAASAGLLSVGCQVVQLGIATTPGVGVMVDHLGAAGGMVITASHNPAPWNGIKALRHDGTAPPAEQARDIIRRFHEDDVTTVEAEAIPTCAKDDSTVTVHVERVLPLANMQAIRDAKLKVVVDSVHGAGGPEARALLDMLGVEVVHLYAEPTGRFPHPPEPTRDNLTELADAVKQYGAALGFAQDPDADRLAIVDEQGMYIGEEYTLALCALHSLDEGQSIVANLSTSRMVDDLAARVGGTVWRTPVGEANVAAAMRQHNARIGGEGNGGIIHRDVSQVRDSLVGIALVLDLLVAHNQPLSKVVRSFPSYAIVKDKIGVSDDLKQRLEPVMRDTFGDARLDSRDGVRVDWNDRWVHVRASNTEPIVRVIAEAKDEAEARGLVEKAKAALGV